MIWFAAITFGKSILAVLAKLPWQAWVAAGLVIVGLWVYHKGETDGAASVQARWDHAVTNQIAAGNRAREQAEASVPPLTAEQRANDAAIPSRGKPCVVYNRYDRDCK